jgi:hypothetical protein
VIKGNVPGFNIPLNTIQGYDPYINSIEVIPLSNVQLINEILDDLENIVLKEKSESYIWDKPNSENYLFDSIKEDSPKKIIEHIKGKISDHEFSMQRLFFGRCLYQNQILRIRF